ncbi:MAG: ABC transporter ATP-binding protein [Bdellovibrionales bacterium]|nr:ABC transporter ATP-binding protein [Bdellovibrionales bacterium]
MNVQLQGLAKSFLQGENSLRILHGLSLDMKSGEIVAVVGESGSGKSTLLSLLAGFERPDAGLIRWDAQAAGDWTEPQWAAFRKESLGFVFQNYYLIPYLTAVENVALPLRLLGHDDPEPEARKMLSELGLEKRLHHLPHQLSGGESQRVAIGRALIHSPRLVLADEPTGSLDARTGQQVLDLLFRQLEGRQQTALIVTHSQEVAQRCHRILTLKQGQLWPV